MPAAVYPVTERSTPYSRSNTSCIDRSVDDELLGLLGVGGAVGDDLHDARVAGLVRRRQRHRRHAADAADLGAEVVHEADRVGALDHRTGDDERAVEPRPEVLGDEVVGDATGGALFEGAGVGQRQPQARGRHRREARAAPRSATTVTIGQRVTVRTQPRKNRLGRWTRRMSRGRSGLGASSSSGLRARIGARASGGSGAGSARGVGRGLGWDIRRLASRRPRRDGTASRRPATRRTRAGPG